MSIEFRGVRQVRHLISDYLERELPVFIGGCRAAWDLTDEALPLPEAYVPRQPQALDRWPLISVTAGRRTHTRQDATVDGEQEYAAEYAVRVYSWVRAVGWDETQDLRDDMAAVVAVALLARQTFGGTGLTVVEGSLVTEPSDVEAVKGDRYIAGSYVGLNVRATEVLTDRLVHPGEQPRATVETITVDTQAHGLIRPDGSTSPLPTHPALA